MKIILEKKKYHLKNALDHLYCTNHSVLHWPKLHSGLMSGAHRREKHCILLPIYLLLSGSEQVFVDNYLKVSIKWSLLVCTRQDFQLILQVRLELE